MNLKNSKSKRILFLTLILIVLSLNIFILNQNISRNSYTNDSDINDINIDLQDNNVKSQDSQDYLSYDNDVTTYSGTGVAWNVTHWANGTEYDFVISFNETSYDIVDIDLGSGWEGYELNATMSDLYDTRNWCNGTFNYGFDNGTYNVGENDSEWIENSFQNWTFSRYDLTIENTPGGARNYINSMSGNYFNSSHDWLDNRDCLELRMNGTDVRSTFDGYGYNEGDKCWWSSSFNISRGRVVDSILKFDVYPYHVLDWNSWEYIISINDIKVYSLGVKDLYDKGTNWQSYSIPQAFWINSSNVFSGIANEEMTTINVSLKYTAASYAYEWEDEQYPSEDVYDNTTYQQIFFDNVELITKTEVKPKQIGLKINSTEVENNNWGKGTAILKDGSWIWTETHPYVSINFSSDDVGELGSYNISLRTDLNLFAIKHAPETYAKIDLESEGTSFSVINDSLVNWTCFIDMKIPGDNEETKMRIEFPKDFNISWFSFSQSDENLLDDPENGVDNSTQGRLIVPVSNITSDSTVIWKLKALSPNYCEDLNIFNNKTGSWIHNNEFLSGEYINITSKITSPLIDISGYIENTQAYLHIRFPNGSIWTEKTNGKNPRNDGTVYFNPFQIPPSPPNYEVGEYEAIITWNNSYSIHGLNETGIICKKFTVLHNSSLTSDQTYYEDIFENETINLRVLFRDLVDDCAIEDAEVYLHNFNNEKHDFIDIGEGYYILVDFNTTGGKAGQENNITVYANSSFYTESMLNITIELIYETTLTTNVSQTLNVQWNENFTIQLNYTESMTKNGIDATPNIIWNGDRQISLMDGIYNVTFNNYAYEVNDSPLLEIDFNETGYENKKFKITIYIIERETEFQLFFNGTEQTDLNIPYLVEIGEYINISLSYKDKSGFFIEGADKVELKGEVFSKNLLRHPNPNIKLYNITIETEELGQGPNVLEIIAEKEGYEPQNPIFTIQISEKVTEYELFLNGSERVDNSIEVNVGDNVNISFIYKDANENFISNADIVELRRTGVISANLTEYKNQYNITINTENMTQGINMFDLYAYKTNYEEKTIPIRIEIINKLTAFSVFVDNILQSSGKTILIDNITIGTSIGISVKYIDSNTTEHVNNATVYLLEEGEMINLEEDPDIEQYSLTIDSAKYGIGVRFFTIYGQKPNYQSHTVDLRITIERIKTKVTPEGGKSTINVVPGDDVIIRIALNNTIFGGTIKGAIVTFTSNFVQDNLKNGTLIEVDNKGIYEVVLENLPEGSYTITITVDAGNNYEFKRYKIIINVVRPEENFLLFQIILGVSIGAAVGLGSYIVAYQRVLKYPKPVRKVRKFRKGLKKKKITGIEIIGRESAVNALYEEQLGKVAKLIKGKATNQIAQSEKIIDKLPEKSSDKVDKKLPLKSTNRSPEKTSDKESKKINNNGGKF